MKNTKQTSPRIAELAARTLANPRASKKDKALAGSALAQTGTLSVRRQRKLRAAHA